MFTRDQVRSYYESRLSQRVNFNLKNIPAKCPFHDDKQASLSIHAETGKFLCHGCGARGNLIDFEIKLTSQDRDECRKKLAEELGLNLYQFPDAVYTYTDAIGRYVFEKIRYKTQNGKRFIARTRDGERYIYNLDSLQHKPIYNLKNVVTARYVFVVGGEKDADNLNAALAAAGKDECAATTNFEGEGKDKWRPEYSRYFAGKTVCVIADNDEIGIAHAKNVCESLQGWAYGVKLLMLPDVPDHGDVSDYLATHNADDLIELVGKTRTYQSASESSGVFVSAADFIEKNAHDEVDWLVRGAIQRGGNGMIVAPPGSGKSYLAADLALSLAMKAPFLGLPVMGRYKVAYMSREDHATLTAWRMKHLYEGKRNAEYLDLDGYLMMNSKREMPMFTFDSEENIRTVMRDLEKFGPDVIIFDVLKVLHGSEENDNTAMHKVMDKITRMTTALNCQAIVVHHEGKADTGGGSLKKRARGASAIGGWPEWVFALSIKNPLDPQSEWIRRVEFETKMAAPLNPIDFMIDSREGFSPLRLRVIENEITHTSAVQ